MFRRLYSPVSIHFRSDHISYVVDCILSLYIIETKYVETNNCKKKTKKLYL